MSAARFIAADWGSTHLRLYLCADDRVLDQRGGPGIATLRGGHAEVVREATASWRADHGPLPLVMAGMVGSRNGWVEVPYVECPAGAATLRAALHRFRADEAEVAIVPGLACTNPLAAPDVMRGEETQLLGALALRPELAHGRRVFAVPGTHCKWVRVEDGRIVRFQTSFVGELFHLLRQHSQLAGGATEGHDADAFAFGLRRAREVASLPHVLFETRSRQLREGMTATAAASFLSGLLIGADVRGACELSDWHSDPPEVTLVGEPALCALYAAALAQASIRAQTLDGAHCVLSGLRMLAAH